MSTLFSNRCGFPDLLLVEPLLALLDEQVELDGADGAVVAQHQELRAAQLERLHLRQELRHGLLRLDTRALQDHDPHISSKVDLVLCFQKL